MISTLLIILLILAIIGAPWGYHSYGWGPSGLIGLVLVVMLILLVLGYI